MLKIDEVLVATIRNGLCYPKSKIQGSNTETDETYQLSFIFPRKQEYLPNIYTNNSYLNHVSWRGRDDWYGTHKNCIAKEYHSATSPNIITGEITNKSISNTIMQ